MVILRFGCSPETLIAVDVNFDNSYKREWFEDPFVAKMVKDIDNATVLAPGVMDSPVLSIVSPAKLSTGLKTLILMYFKPDREYFATNCGDNCSKWILEIGKRQDIHIALTNVMNFGDSFDILYEQQHITNMEQLTNIFAEDYYDKLLY